MAEEFQESVKIRKNTFIIPVVLSGTW